MEEKPVDAQRHILEQSGRTVRCEAATTVVAAASVSRQGLVARCGGREDEKSIPSTGHALSMQAFVTPS